MESSLEMSRGIRNACQREHQSLGFISSDSLGEKTDSCDMLQSFQGAIITNQYEENLEVEAIPLIHS